MFDDYDKLAEQFAKSRREEDKRGWLVALAMALVAAIGFVVAMGVYLFYQLF